MASKKSAKSAKSTATKAVKAVKAAKSRPSVEPDDFENESTAVNGSEFTIESGIDLPPRTRRTAHKYPFDLMDVGDRIVIPAPVTRSHRSLVTTANRRLAPKRFESRTLTESVHGVEGLGIWRVQDGE